MKLICFSTKCRDQVRPDNKAHEFNTHTPFSPFALRLCWFSFVILHGYCFIYFAAMSVGYWNLPGTTLDVWLYLYGLSLGGEYDRIIAVILGSVAAVHFGYLVWILSWTIWKRTLIFAVYDVNIPSCVHTEPSNHAFMLSIATAYRAGVSSIGQLGVDGPYFDLVLMCREIVETALQTQQAYRMSTLLPRTQLNRGYVALLVVNCWSTALIHSAFHKISTQRRFYVIVCDSVLDMVTSVGISTALVAIYSFDYDFDRSEFPSYKWYEDVWLIHILSEFQLLLVTSWSDLAMRVVFALSMLGNMDNMKKLLSTPVQLERRNTGFNRRFSAVLPQSTVTDVASAYKNARIKAVVESRVVQTFFFVWGLVLLILHLYAESISGLRQCAMQVKPWGTSDQACSLTIIDCHLSNFTGKSVEIESEWELFDSTSPMGVAIRHCPDLEVPEMLTTFSSLKLLKFYNSTITRWDASAAISQLHHPNLIMLFVVRVNMTDGLLPAGLLANDFPSSLKDVEFCITNIRSVPDDLDLKWAKSGTLYFEHSYLTEVTPSMIRLTPFVFSLALNPITSIPAAVFKDSLGYLHIGSTLITELPEHVGSISPLLKLRVDNTKVSLFWDWIDPVVGVAGTAYKSLPTILATNTPYCSDLRRIFDGDMLNFSSALQRGRSALLSDPSIVNWPTLKKVVQCARK